MGINLYGVRFHGRLFHYPIDLREKEKRSYGRHACLPELVIIVRCEEESLEQVQMIMHHYGAWKLGIMES